jgi:hypothetical protein
VMDGDVVLLQVKSRETKMVVVDHFTYLGSIMSRDRNIINDVEDRMSKASRVFGSLQCPIFFQQSYSLITN